MKPLPFRSENRSSCQFLPSSSKEIGTLESVYEFFKEEEEEEFEVGDKRFFTRGIFLQSISKNHSKKEIRNIRGYVTLIFSII